METHVNLTIRFDEVLQVLDLWENWEGSTMRLVVNFRSHAPCPLFESFVADRQPSCAAEVLD
jgi:hypothetical protein